MGDGLGSRDQSELLLALDQLDAAGLLRSQHRIHVRCELPATNALQLFAPFAGHARLRIISLMGHTPGQRQWTDVGHARTYYTGKKGWTDARFAEELAAAPQRQARYVGPHRKWFADFARANAVALATHDDSTVEHADQAQALGAMTSEFPTSLAAARRAQELGLKTIAGAPNVVRGGSHSANVAATELAKARVLDGLSSNSVPASLLQADWRLHHVAGFSLPAAVGVVTEGPARAAGFFDRGRLWPGLRADLVRVRELHRMPVVRAVFVGGDRRA